MNTRFFSMVVIAIFSCFAASAQNSYRYSVDLTKPVKDELKIELLAPRITKPVILFYIPKIVPGTYTNSDFGKFVHNIKAFDKAGKALSVTAMPDSNSWQIKKPIRCTGLNTQWKIPGMQHLNMECMKWQEPILKRTRILY